MTTLKDLLGDLADEAKVYPVTLRAERAVRRRRYAVRFAPVAAAVVVGSIAVPTWNALDGGANQAGGGPTAGPTAGPVPTVGPDNCPVPGPPLADLPGPVPGTGASAVVPWLPKEITVPDGIPGALPTNQGVGRAAGFYDRGNRDRRLTGYPGATLFLSDGTQYQLDPTGRPLSLSPDGRWLLYNDDRSGGVYLRDLTGTTVRKLVSHGGTQTVWDRAGRWVIVTDGSVLSRYDLASGQARELTGLGAGPTAFAGATADGVVVVDLDPRDPANPAPPATTFRVRIIDPGTGAVRREHVIRPDLRAGEQLPSTGNDPFGFDMKAALRGDKLVVNLLRRVADHPVTVEPKLADDQLTIDLATGRVVKRTEITDPWQRTFTRTCGDSTQILLSAGYAILVRAPGEPVYATVGGVGPDSEAMLVALTRVDPDTGRATTITRIKGDIHRLTVRG